MVHWMNCRFGWDPGKAVINTWVNNMRKEYDFSNGKRGKFFHKNITLDIPVYLNSDNFEYAKNIIKFIFIQSKRQSD